MIDSLIEKWEEKYNLKLYPFQKEFIKNYLVFKNENPNKQIVVNLPFRYGKKAIIKAMTEIIGIDK